MKSLSELIRSLSLSRQKTPLYLVEITGEGATSRFAIFRKTITFSGNQYSGGLAFLSNFQFSSDLSSESITLTLKQSANSGYVTQILSTRIPTIRITITKCYYEGSTTITSGSTIYVGDLRDLKVNSTTIQMEFVPRMSRLDNNVHRIATKISCNHRLYGPQCRALKSGSFGGKAFQVTAIVTAIDTSQKKLTTDLLTVHPEYTASNGFFTDGVASFTLNGETFVQRLHILQQNGNDIYVLGSFFGLDTADVLNQTITLLAGCKFDRDSCVNKFNNLDANSNPNILAFPLIPVRNPSMDGLS